MKVKFWGTRGSLPRAQTHRLQIETLEAYVKEAKRKGIGSLDIFLRRAKAGTLIEPLSFGGNTTCTEFSFGSQRIYVDMGTGFREAGDQDIAEGLKETHLFLSHTHWDHIMGLPFYRPLYKSGHKIVVHHVHKNAPDSLKLLFNGINFPVKWADVREKFEFHPLKLYGKTKVGRITAIPFALDHPGGSFGFRFEAGGQAAAIGVDGEFKRRTAKELGKDHAFYRDLDLFIFDSQYHPDEMQKHEDWGHSTGTVGVEIALREGIRRLALTHHDPWSSDSKIQNILKAAQDHLRILLPQFKSTWSRMKQPGGPQVFSAYDGLELDLK